MNLTIKKTGVLEYNLYEVLEYVQSYNNPYEQIDLPTEFNPLLNDMLANFANAKIVFKAVFEKGKIEYTPLAYMVSLTFPILGTFTFLQTIDSTIAFYVEKRDEGDWYGAYFPLLEYKNLKGKTPIKLMKEIKEVIKSKRK